ncbi:MAG: hypothetical protein ACXAB7_17000 [Candidatus Kariarchaeaceae archaeon]|jgi:hypothetical protein
MEEINRGCQEALAKHYKITMKSNSVMHERKAEGEKHFQKNEFYRYSNRLRKVWITTVVLAVPIIIIPIFIVLVVALLIYSINIQVKLNGISLGLIENLERM